MDACFPLLKLKHHFEQRNTQGREELKSEQVPNAGAW